MSLRAVQVLEYMSRVFDSVTNLMQLAPVSSQVPLSINIKALLRAEEHNASVGNQSGQIISLGIVELGELNTMNFSSNLRVVVEDCSGVS